jgi:F-type H+-transporting ATPase subunit epsilon
MSSSAAAVSSYWRVAGMSYLKYSNLCADMLRSALKEPAKGAAKAREAIYYRSAVWKDGVAQNQVVTDLTEGTAGKLS